MDESNLQQRMNQLEQRLATFENKYATHQHSNTDGTNYLRKNIVLDADQAITVGDGQWQTFRLPSATDGTNYISGMSVGTNTTPGVTQKSPNMQMFMTHVPGSAAKFSFLTAECAPLVVPYENTSISTTLGGTTVTIAGYGFATDELAGAYINIYDAGTLIETQTIASNTATVITISGTWLASTTGTFKIYNPVFLGRTDTIWHRVYVEEGTSVGGVRFGVGSTANGQNGLLYMDAAGDLFWRDKANASTQLNSSSSGSFVVLGDGSTITIAGGSVTPTTGYHEVATEGGGATDDLDTIVGSGLTEGSILVIRPDSSANTVVAKDDAGGNLRLAGDFTMDHTEDTLTLIWSGVVWYEISRSDNDS